MKFQITIVTACVLALSGCISERPADKDTLAKLSDQCSAYGFKKGTDQFSSCMLQLDQNRMAANRQHRRLFAAALMNAGNQMQQNANNQALINAANRPVNCTSSAFAGTVRTTCQ